MLHTILLTIWTQKQNKTKQKIVIAVLSTSASIQISFAYFEIYYRINPLFYNGAISCFCQLFLLPQNWEKEIEKGKKNRRRRRRKEREWSTVPLNEETIEEIINANLFWLVAYSLKKYHWIRIGHHEHWNIDWVARTKLCGVSLQLKYPKGKSLEKQGIQYFIFFFFSFFLFVEWWEEWDVFLILCRFFLFFFFSALHSQFGHFIHVTDRIRKYGVR